MHFLVFVCLSVCYFYEGKILKLLVMSRNISPYVNFKVRNLNYDFSTSWLMEVATLDGSTNILEIES